VTSITDNFIVARSSFDRFLSVPKKISSHAPGERAFAFDAAPLAGIGHDSPYLETFLIFSIDFGAGETKELEEPASSRFHR
jgi:hypothetical protein